jgi:DNA primase
LDADEPGREAAMKFREKYIQKGFTVSINLPNRGKDWNEYLLQRGSSREKGDKHKATTR